MAVNIHPLKIIPTLALGLLLFSFALLCPSKVSEAQVIAGFNQPGELDGFVNGNSVNGGMALDSIYQMADPANSKNGILNMKLVFAGPDKGSVHSSRTIRTGGAQQLVYWIFLPSGIPDSLRFAIYVADNANMKRREVDYWAADVPKQTWYPLTFPLTEMSITYPDFDVEANAIAETGLQVDNYHGGSPSWSGSIYVDSVSFLGAYPGVYADFSSGLQGFSELWPNGWVDSISWVAGPVGDGTGIVRLKLVDGSSATGSVAFGIQPAAGYRASTQNMIVFWLYVDSAFPAAAFLQPFAQDNNSWAQPASRSITTYTGLDLPKDKWYPVYFDMSIANLLSGGVFDSQTYPLGKFGFQVGGPSWNGSVYVDKVEFISAATPPPPPRWIAADFDSAALGIQSFYVPPAGGCGTIRRTLDTLTGNGTFVLEADVDFGSAPHVFSVVRNRVPLLDSNDQYKFATRVSFDVYIPAGMPEHAVVLFFLSSGSNDSAAVADTVNGVDLKAGSWNTLALNTDSLVQTGVINPAHPANAGVSIYYPPPYDTTTWSGSIYFDNLVLNGIMRPAQIADAVRIAGDIPAEFRLYDNYPNPFNPSTVIRYDIPRNMEVSIRVYDVIGREVATLVNRKHPAGRYQVLFNGSGLASGVYFCRIIAGSLVRTSKMVLIK